MMSLECGIGGLMIVDVGNVGCLIMMNDVMKEGKALLRVEH